MLDHTLVDLLSDMRLRAQVASSLAKRILLTRDIALYSLVFYLMSRGCNFSFTMGSHILRLPAYKRLMFNYRFGKTLRTSMVVLTGRDCPAICAFPVTAYFSDAQRIGWDLDTGQRFPVVTVEGGRGRLSCSAARTTANLESYLRIADLLNHLPMHSFRVGGSIRKSLAGTAVDEIMKVGGWKTE